MGYEVVITASAQDDLDGLRAFDLRIVIQAIEDHLTHQPKLVSRSRIKELAQPAISQYRLRVGDYRVYYDVHDAENRSSCCRFTRKVALRRQPSRTGGDG